MRSLILALLLPFCCAWALKPLTNEQVIEDLQEVKRKIRDYYGPLQMKEKTIQFQLDTLIAEAEKEIQAAKSEDEALGAIARALGKLNDGHVSITFPSYSSKPGSVGLPLFLTPVEGKAIVANVDAPAQSLGIEVGDEVVTIDGKPTMDLVGSVSKYRSFGNPRSNLHLLLYATSRPTYMTEIAPRETEARLEVKKPSGKAYPIRVIWRPRPLHEKNVLFVEPVKGKPVQPESPKASSFLFMGAKDPFFISAANKAKFHITPVSANAENLAKFKVPADAPDVFAALYRHSGKNILLVRQPAYDTEHYEKGIIQQYKAVLSQYEPFADVLVIDQTHNPGGDTRYLEDFFRLFIQDKSASFVQFLRADRKWVRRMESVAQSVDKTLESESARQLLLRAKVVEDANARGDFFTPIPVPINLDPEVSPDPEYTWKKPLLILTDELAGSCGDIFPLLMKRLGKKTFGQATMGLGGTVESVGELTHSGAEVRLTRGLLALYNPAEKYTEKDFVENTGVPVDIEYEHTVEDFRAGYLKYVESFSKAAVEQIP